MPLSLVFVPPCAVCEIETSPSPVTSIASGFLVIRRTVPAIEELPIDEIWTGFRPGSRDDAPILGATGISGLAIATGHHRNGYLLAPVTASAIEALVTGAGVPAVAHAFGLDRFAGRPSEIRNMRELECAGTGT